MEGKRSSCFGCSWKSVLVLVSFTFMFTFTNGFHDSFTFIVGNCSRNTTVQPMMQTGKESSMSKTEKALTIALAADIMQLMQQERMKKQARTKCAAINGTYIESSGHCLRTKLLGNGTKLCQASRAHEYIFLLDMTTTRGTDYWLYITGNTWSIALTMLLFVTYIADKELHTSYGKCIAMLAVNTMLQQSLQMLSLYAKENVKYCTAVAVLHHWSYLAMFLWMASIAFDFASAFSHLRRPAKELQQRRIKMYAILSEGIPTAVVTMCVIVDCASNKAYFGYGENSACFITNHLANIVFFSLPIGSIIIFNIVCLGIALVFIFKTRRSSKLVLRATRKKGNPTMIVLALKLSLLLGVGWIFGPIARLTLNETVLNIYVFFNSFQGFFIFGAFCANEKVLHFYKQTIRHAIVRISPPQSTESPQETKL